MLYLGIEGRYDDLAHHTIYLAEDYLEQPRRDRDAGTSSRDDPSFYVQNACVTDPSLAPRGHEHALRAAAGDAPASQRRLGREKRRGSASSPSDQLAKIGLDDVESRIRFERMITPADWDQGYEIHRGATFNLAHSLWQMLHLRPRNRFEDLESVYLVGGGTHPGSGLPVIYESARITSRLLGQDLGTAVPVDGHRHVRPGSSRPGVAKLVAVA